MGLLTLLIQRNAWDELHESLTSRRLIAELFRTDRLGRTPLHYACAKKQAPQDVIALMLHFYGTKWFASRDICGNTPLHAAAGNSNFLVVKLLLTELHSRRLQYVNDVGSTPLLMAWKKYLDPSFTLFGHVDSVGKKSPQVLENLRLLRTVPDVVMLQDDADYLYLLDVWNKTILLISRAKGGSSTSSTSNMNRPLHDILTVGGHRNVQCPTVALWLAIRLYPHHLQTKDEHGNLPIHLAAKHDGLRVIPMSHVDAAAVHGDERQCTSGEQLSIGHATDSALAQLAKVYPKGALTLTRNDRLPIHLAIESGTPYKEGISALVHAAPQTLEQRDVQTKLQPFLLAATSPKAPLTVVWELVRARPDLISSMVNKTGVGVQCKRVASAREEASAKKAKLLSAAVDSSSPRR